MKTMITSGETYKELTASEITQRAIKMLLERNVYAWRQNNLAVRHRKGTVTPGIPDLPGYNKSTGVATFTEVKKLGDTLKPAQIKFMINAKEAGCVTLVATQVRGNAVLIEFADYYEQYYHVKI